MERAFTRQTEVIVGIGFLIGALIVFFVSITATSGPTSLILLVVAGVCLLVSLYFLAGGGDRFLAEPASPAPTQAPYIPAPPSMKPMGSTTTVVCRNCGASAPVGVSGCPRCGRPF